MSATSSSSDKYLFLFTTDSDNLLSVKSALQDFYKYPASAINTFESTGCNNFINTYKTLVETLSGTDPSVPVYRMPDTAGEVPVGEIKMNTLVVVISGNSDIAGTGLKDAANNILTWAQLRQTIFGTLPQPVGPPKTYPYQLYTEIHVIFASPFCNSFLSEWDSNVPVTAGTLIIPSTVLDQIDQPGRELFLSNWAKELQMETSTMLDSNGRISFNDIAASLHGASVANFFRSVAPSPTDKYFPGYSTLEIKDGNPDWWESPDIYINSFGNDLYSQDAINRCNIQVHIEGTHPVKCFWIGAKHFGSGLGSADAIIVGNPAVPDVTLPAVIKPGEFCTYYYDLFFSSTTTHRCIVARAKFTTILGSDIDDYSEWSIEANANEAQRNIDPLPLGSPVQPPTPPDPAQNPDPDPQPDAGDQNNTGDRSLNNLRGFKEHIYSITNPFREKRNFRIVFHKEFEKYSRILKFEFFLIKEGNVRTMKSLKIVRIPYSHIPLTLESREKVDLLFNLSVRPKVRFDTSIRLPLEFQVEIKGRKLQNPRKSPFVKIDKKYASAGGLTVKIWPQNFSIKGRVFNILGKPVPGARVIIRTINGLQAAILLTDREGAYYMPKISPDAYRMSVETKEWHTPLKIVNMFERDMNIDFSEPKRVS